MKKLLSIITLVCLLLCGCSAKKATLAPANFVRTEKKVDLGEYSAMVVASAPNLREVTIDPVRSGLKFERIFARVYSENGMKIYMHIYRGGAWKYARFHDGKIKETRGKKFEGGEAFEAMTLLGKAL